MTSLEQFIEGNIVDDELLAFSRIFLKSLLNRKGEPFPINGQVAMSWLGYARNDHFKRAISGNLEAGVDYDTHTNEKPQNLNMTVDAFKIIGHIAQNARANNTRKHCGRLVALIEEYRRSNEMAELQAALAGRARAERRVEELTAELAAVRGRPEAPAVEAPAVRPDVPTPPSPATPTTPTPTAPIAAHEFHRFITECCVVDPTETASATVVEITGAHRQWSRSICETTTKALHEYISANFKRAKVYNEACKAKLASYMGLSLRPASYRKPAPLDEYDAFIEDRCDLSYVGRASAKEVADDFEAWKRESGNGSGFAMSPESRKRLSDAMSARFVPSVVYIGRQSAQGYFGFSLKSQKEEDKYAGFNLATALKKPVIEIEVATGRVTRTFDSQADAALAVGCNPGTMSKYIKNNTARGAFTYRFKP
jgi:hypothetical protein